MNVYSHLQILLFAVLLTGSVLAEDTPLNLLLKGQYHEIKPGDTPHAKAIWAFARYYLAPDKAMAEAAKSAHEAGEDLGTFVWMICQREGVMVRCNEKMMFKLNYQLRISLEKKANPSAIEKYMLSKLIASNEEGVINQNNPEDMKVYARYNREAKWKKLIEAANDGFAQACDDVGSIYQGSKDYEKAYKWYEKAAQRGLASGLKNQGYLKLTGHGTKTDLREGVELTIAAAEAGDIFAMINMGVFYDRGSGVERSQEKARKWIDAAAASGHYMGHLEKGLALLKGNYDYAVDEKAGKAELQLAVNSGASFALLQVASFYYQGEGVQKNVKKAIEFAEASFVQGMTKAGYLLAHIYNEGAEGVPKDKELGNYWRMQTNVNMSYAFNIDEAFPEVRKHLEQLDPFKLKIE